MMTSHRQWPSKIRRWQWLSGVVATAFLVSASGCRASRSLAARVTQGEEDDAAPPKAPVDEAEAPIVGGEPIEGEIVENAPAEADPNLDGLAENVDDEDAPEVSAAELEVLTQLREQAGRLDQSKLALAKREADLKRVETELQVRLDRINELEDRLQRELGIGKAAQDRRDERVNGLAELVMTMPPQSGAEILSQMPNGDAEAIVLAISRKNSRKAAKVLAQMPADRAAQLSSAYLQTDPNLPGTDDLVPKAPAKFDNPAPSDGAPPKSEANAPAAKDAAAPPATDKKP